MRTSPSGKSYIGQTSFTEGERWKQHCYVAFDENCAGYNYPLSKAIRKYGPENFVCTILEDNIDDQEELNKREIYWISYYDTFSRGLNATRGGEGNKKINSQEIIDLWEKGYCVRDIAILQKTDSQTVLRHLNKTSEECQKRGPVILRNRKSDKTFQNYKIGRPTPVSCYDMQTGEFVKSFNSMNEAKKCFNVKSNGYISSAIAGYAKSAYGYFWKEGHDETKLSNQFLNENRKRKKMEFRHVVCVETNKIYASAYLAQQITGVSHTNILRVCKSNRFTAGGFHWRYSTKEDEESMELIKPEINPKKPINNKEVICVETGKKYLSMKEASIDTGAHPSAISDCCNKKRNRANKLHWIFADEAAG